MDCRRPFPTEQMRGRLCKRCSNREREEQRKMSHKREVTKALAQLNKKLEAAQSGSPALSEITFHLSSILGGPEKIAELIVEEMERVRHDPNFKPQLVQKYLTSIIRMITVENASRQETLDMSDVNDEDLRAVLRDVAIETLKEDPELLQEVIDAVQEGCNQGVGASQDGRAETLSTTAESE